MDRILTLKNTQNNHNTGINLDSWLGNLTAQEPNDSIHLYVELNREGIRKCNSQPWLEPHVKVKDENHGHIDMNIDKKEVDFVSTFFFS